MIVLDFYNFNALSGLLNIFATVYISILAIYVSNKEFDRWYDRHESRHPGELFVIIWSILMVFLFILSFVFSNHYQIPNSVISSYIAVLTMLAVTRKSKEIYGAKHKKKK
jgi:uncharacterized BrkB/YihY/UPF0761 family membrane protein